MEKKIDISRLVTWTFAVLLCLTLFSTWLMSNMYARYSTNSSGADGASVAAYVFQLEDASDSQMLKLENIKKPGDSQEYTFSVTNKSGSRISDVAQSYTVNLEVEGSMPIVCKIKDLGTEQTVCEAGNTAEFNQNQSTSDEVEFPAAKASTTTYKVTAEWPENYNDEKYASASGTSAVTLTVNAQQLD